MLAGPAFGLTLIAFYYSSSKLTKFKAHIKQQLEENFKEGGQRTPAQARLTPQLVYCRTRSTKQACAFSCGADHHANALTDGVLGLRTGMWCPVAQRLLVSMTFQTML